MSCGGGSYSNTYPLIFDYANSHEMVLIAAAGNSNINLPSYPASYTHVISVGASDENDRKAWFSNYGPNVDAMAPGNMLRMSCWYLKK